jgi:hypothetical protein
MSHYASAEFSFDGYIESGFDRNEYVKLDFWNGNSWNEILSLDGNVDQENTWHNELVQLDSQYLNDEFEFRFRSKISRSFICGCLFSGADRLSSFKKRRHLVFQPRDDLAVFG